MEVLMKHKIKKRTRSIYYQGDKYHRWCNYHGVQIYIICFYGVNKCQIEFPNGEQKIVEVDDEKFDLIEYKS